MTTAATIACLVLGALAGLQIALASGLPWGRFAWGGQHPVLPRPLRVASALSVALYALLGAILLARADVISLGISERTVEIATWVVTGYFTVGIAMNLASRSRPERLTMTPACAVLALLSGAVALG